jgi:hypothetical protein
MGPARGGGVIVAALAGRVDGVAASRRRHRREIDARATKAGRRRRTLDFQLRHVM